jgi:peptidyl-prolyl cis-trans isomerase SDCCAG10
MDEAPFLDKKYVIFGTIRGDTIFNALRIGKTETIGDSGELAVQDNAPRIINVRVMEHTFEDLVATKDDFVPWKQEQYKQNGDTQEDILKKRRKKRKGKRDLNVLSFGGEMEDMEQGLLESTKGIQSSHDIFANKSMNSKVEEPGMEMDSGKAKRLKVRKDIEKEKETDFKEQHDMEVKDMENKHDTEIQPPPLQVNATDAADTASPVENASLSSKIQQSRSLPSETEEKSHEENETRAKEPPKVSAIEARRLKYLHKRSEKELGRKPSKQREDDTMLKLNEFQRKILQVKGVKDKAYENKGAKVDNSLASRMARKLETLQDNRSDIEEKPIYNGQVLEVEKEDENIEYATGTDWLKSKFKCKRHIDQNAKDRALGGDGRNMEEYEVVDDKILRRNSKGYARDQKQSKRHHV